MRVKSLMVITLSVILTLGLAMTAAHAAGKYPSPSGHLDLPVGAPAEAPTLAPG